MRSVSGRSMQNQEDRCSDRAHDGGDSVGKGAREQSPAAAAGGNASDTEISEKATGQTPLWDHGRRRAIKTIFSRLRP